MTADPEPLHAFGDWNSKCSVVETDSNAIEATTADGLELQRRMRRVLTQQGIVATRNGLDLFRKRSQALPEAAGGKVLQISRDLPA